jgi:hypothetical protein
MPTTKSSRCRAYRAWRGRAPPQPRTDTVGPTQGGGRAHHCLDDLQWNGEARPQPGKSSHDRPPRALDDRQPRVVEQAAQHGSRARLHDVENAGKHRPSGNAPHDRRDVEEQSSGGITEPERTADGIRRRGAVEAGDRRPDHADRGQSHRGQRPGQSLHEAEAEVDPQVILRRDVLAGAVVREREQRRHRAGLSKPECAGPVDRPLDVLRLPVMLLDPAPCRRRHPWSRRSPREREAPPGSARRDSRPCLLPSARLSRRHVAAGRRSGARPPGGRSTPALHASRCLPPHVPAEQAGRYSALTPSWAY